SKEQARHVSKMANLQEPGPDREVEPGAQAKIDERGAPDQRVEKSDELVHECWRSTKASTFARRIPRWRASRWGMFPCGASSDWRSSKVASCRRIRIDGRFYWIAVEGHRCLARTPLRQARDASAALCRSGWARWK